MSKLIEFLLGSILIVISTIALIFFSTLHYVLRAGVTDCVWHSSVKAWIDSNRDGHMNHREFPLSHVAIHVDDVANNLTDIGWPAVTDLQGDAQLRVSMPDCSNSMLEIYADAPQGFRVATKPRLEVNRDFWGNLASGRVYYFGFSSDQ